MREREMIFRRGSLVTELWFLPLYCMCKYSIMYKYTTIHVLYECKKKIEKKNTSTNSNRQKKICNKHRIEGV